MRHCTLRKIRRLRVAGIPDAYRSPNASPADDKTRGNFSGVSHCVCNSAICSTSRRGRRTYRSDEGIGCRHFSHAMKTGIYHGVSRNLITPRPGVCFTNQYIHGKLKDRYMKTNLLKICKTLVLTGTFGFFAFGGSNSFASYSHNDDHKSYSNSPHKPQDIYDIKVYGKEFARLPDLGSPSLPAFGTKINVSFSKTSSSRTLTATERGSMSSFNSTTQKYGISRTGYLLTANFDNSGAFTSGSVLINGKFNGSGTSELLMTADLTRFSKSSDGSMWGFNTNNIWCNAAIDAAAGGCTTSEVVYLSLSNSQKSLNKSWKTTGVALTSVPVPTAAWLFGSGLLGLSGVARRKRA